MGIFFHKEKPSVGIRGNANDSRKKVCILYNGSDQVHKKNARAFRDALQGGDGAKMMHISFVDVSQQHFDGFEWLQHLKNVLVVCINDQDNGQVRDVLDRDGVRDGGNQNTMHAKVLSVSFGTNPPQRIMGDLLKRVQVDMQRDFCFNFQNLNSIVAHDFDDSDTMRELRTTIISVMKN